ncbi:IclR family transcriptional regulator [Bacillus sp. 1NLA3E]|uniref:IclR family transcriptional regulator n=1 Tax=Bacillus sp. 1NLA3E TaxID=666686 RepID=UPI000247EFE1|nr:IclR family transcriptional regulator [Bacillus sp. 1NLA3E]AGK53599.1 IclR family transcriptional regulator [Bacillus sp. 1NLA3E]
MAERYIQSVERAADVLELFLYNYRELSVKEISEKLELSKSTVHGIIKTLEYRGYLKQNPDNLKYKLGIKLFELGTVVSNQFNIVEIARPIIKKLVEDLKETVHLVLYDRGEVIYVEKMDGPHALRIYSQIGKKAPIHCTGVGKAILAFQEEEDVEWLLSNNDLKKFTQYTMTDKVEIKEHIQSVRQQGYSIDDEEIEIGLKCIAAPIFNRHGKAVAAISCASPKFRLNEERLNEVIQSIKQAAIKISESIGYKLE